MRRPIQIAIYIYRAINDEREYLLLKRTHESGGFWQGVTGGVEDDESILETAIRELQEETGYQCTNIRQLDYQETFAAPDSMKHHYDADVTTLTEYAFDVEIESFDEPTIDPREHVEFKWVPIAVALEMLHFPGNIRALKISVQLP